MSFYRTLPISNDKNLRAYVIGLAVGDGNLSNQTGRVTKLRITCDDQYPLLRDKIVKSLETLLPNNKIGAISRKNSGCSDVYVSSKHLEPLLGWRAGAGSKYSQNVSTPAWIKKNDKYKIAYLRGLIETDGSIYQDRGYTMVMFTTIIRNLALEVLELINSLGFGAKFYKVNQKSNKYKYNRQNLYHVRLSKNVQKFIDLVKPEKT